MKEDKLTNAVKQINDHVAKFVPCPVTEEVEVLNLWRCCACSYYCGPGEVSPGGNCNFCPSGKLKKGFAIVKPDILPEDAPKECP